MNMPHNSPLARKVRVFFEWNWGMLFPADIAYLGFSWTKRKAATAKSKKE